MDRTEAVVSTGRLGARAWHCLHRAAHDLYFVADRRRNPGHAHRVGLSGGRGPAHWVEAKRVARAVAALELRHGDGHVRATRRDGDLRAGEVDVVALNGPAGA